MKSLLQSTCLFFLFSATTAVADEAQLGRAGTRVPENLRAMPPVATQVPPAWPAPRSSPARWPYIVIAGGIVLLGILVMRLRDRSGPNFDDAPTIDVLATRALTGKTKVMLIEAKDREMLLSVTDRGAELLSEWLEDDPIQDVTPAPAAFTRPIKPPPVITDDKETIPSRMSPHPPQSSGSPTASRNESEAIHGLLQLRKNPTPGTASRPPWTRLQRRRH